MARTFNIPFMKYRGLLFALSMGLVAVAISLVAVKGLNFGIDFTGGLTLAYQFQDEVDEGKITQTLKDASVPPFVVQRIGEEKDKTFVVKSELPEKTGEKASLQFTQALGKAFGPDKVSLVKEEYVGPTVGRELRVKAIYAVLLAWLFILFLVGFRFDFYFAPGAIVALIHVVAIVMGAFALTGREVNLTVVASILTVIGYSINDTIVIFDRIREDLQKHKGMELVELVNTSINSTLVRTLITSVCVLFVSLVLFFRAEGDIQSFGFAMILGVLTGTYSSVFIASPVFIFLKQHGHRIGLKKKVATAH